MADRAMKKVYVNPNFNKHTTNSCHLPKVNLMYVNPTFLNMQNENDFNRPKIYVNPNFIPSNNLKNDVFSDQSKVNLCELPSQQLINTNHIDRTILPTPIAKSRYSLVRNTVQTSARPNKIPCINTLMSTTANHVINNTDKDVSNSQIILDVNKVPIMPSSHFFKSRYSLVKHVENKIQKKRVLDTFTSTVEVGRYKLMPLKDMKKGFYNEKCVKYPRRNSIRSNSTKITQIRNHGTNSLTSISLENKYKLLKTVVPEAGKERESRYALIRNSSITPNNNIMVNPLVRLKKPIREKLKKNNIPCPLFKKFGKCLRNLHGNCDFLHDKKHVSLCRKFLKGICHDENCFLSHDITAKKMPTCYFYLQGICTKEQCPYLHIKLNEKTKICYDFLKGYCEKGSKCLNRHVNLCPDIASKGSCARKICPYPHTNRKTKTHLINKGKMGCSGKKTIKPKETTTNLNSEVIESRYYEEQKQDSSVEPELCEVIRPTRCKLGILPSFIKL